MTVRSVGPVHFNSGGKGSEVALFGAFHVMHVNRMTLDAPTKNANVEGQFRAPVVWRVNLVPGGRGILVGGARGNLAESDGQDEEEDSLKGGP